MSDKFNTTLGFDRFDLSEQTFLQIGTLFFSDAVGDAKPSIKQLCRWCLTQGTRSSYNSRVTVLSSTACCMVSLLAAASFMASAAS